MARVNFKTPVGRAVSGSFYQPQTKDAEGKQMLYKSGVDVGKPRVNFFFALAIPKGKESHWNQTEWGAKIWQVGQAGFPNGQANAPTFAWKVVDGDSTIPNSKNKKPVDREGYAGNWVISFSSSFAPKIYVQDASGGWVQDTTPDKFKIGHYYEVSADVDDNKSQMQPGVFINHNLVAFRAFGEEIFFGQDANEVGFGDTALPTGASTVPIASSAPMPSAPPAAPTIPVVPNPAMLAPAPARQMTAKANGIAYEAYIDQGWTDALLVQHGMMLA